MYIKRVNNLSFPTFVTSECFLKNVTSIYGQLNNRDIMNNIDERYQGVDVISLLFSDEQTPIG